MNILLIFLHLHIQNIKTLDQYVTYQILIIYNHNL